MGYEKEFSYPIIIEKRKYMKKWLVLAALMLSLSGTAVQAAEISETKGLIAEEGNYYYYSKGEMLTDKWKNIKKRTYYFGKDGAAVTGWKTLKKGKKYQTFYFNAKGVLQKKKTKAVDQDLVKLLDSAINESGASKVSGKKAIKKIFNYMKDEYKYGRVYDMQFDKGWENDFAKKMLLTKNGSCYHDAAAFALAAKRATGYEVRICTGEASIYKKDYYQAHGWVEIKIGKTWYTCDVNAARNSSYRKGKYFMQKSSKVAKYYKAAEKVAVEI